MDQEWHLSTGNVLTVLVRIGKHSHRETLDGAFAFHDGKNSFFAIFHTASTHWQALESCNFIDLVNTISFESLTSGISVYSEKVGGTQRPDLACAVEFLGSKSPASGEVKNPATEHVYWNIEGPLNCSQIFKPNFTQSLTLSVSLMKIILIWNESIFS